MPQRFRQSTGATPSDTADRLHSAAIHLLRALRREDRATGLSAPRLSVLSVVVFAGPLSMSALATAEQVRAPTMTRLVRGLERDRLVRRMRDPGDRRVLKVSATEAGRALLLEGKRRRVARLAEAVSRLPEPDRGLLRRAGRR